jgi:hypothetical protein
VENTVLEELGESRPRTVSLSFKFLDSNKKGGIGIPFNYYSYYCEHASINLIKCDQVEA